MSMLKEFREFAIRGNVVDLAVGVIIGGAFGKIVTSVVEDLIMPLFGAFVSLDFSNLFLPLSSKVQPGMTLAQVKTAGLPVLAWGNFLTVSLNFIIIAFCIFLMVRAINRLRRVAADEPAKPAEAPAPTKEEVLLTEIRDAIRANKA